MFRFILNAVLLGVGLAMDAFSCSLADGLNEPEMKWGRMALIAGTFALFQFAMPMIGWFCVHSIAEAFAAFQPFIPWIALGLLCWIGGKMVYEARHPEENDAEVKKLSFTALLVQGVATSIDALSVGFTIAEYTAGMAFVACLLIGVVTLVICLAGLQIGKSTGLRFAGKASLFGGLILIGIGLEIFITSFFG